MWKLVHSAGWNSVGTSESAESRLRRAGIVWKSDMNNTMIVCQNLLGDPPQVEREYMLFACYKLEGLVL